MKRWLAILCIIAGGGVAVHAQTTNRLCVMAWNVGNLFDAKDDPDNPFDDEFTPTGAQNWTEEAYQSKLKNLAWVIAQVKPDILGVAEVENRRVLVDLQQTLKKEHAFEIPEIIHREGPDYRGIEVAILSRLKPESMAWLPGNPSGREMACGVFQKGGASFTIVMCHWKSKIVPKGTTEQAVTAQRVHEASVVRTFLDGQLRQNPNVALLVMGDFNEDFASPTLTRHALFLTDRAKLKSSPAALYNLAADLPESKRGTYRYKQHWEAIDSISVSQPMLAPLSPGAWTVEPNAYTVYRDSRLVDKNGNPKGFRAVVPKDRERYTYGYSDHLPVTVELWKRF